MSVGLLKVARQSYRVRGIKDLELCMTSNPSMSDDGKQATAAEHPRISTDEQYWSRKFSVNTAGPMRRAPKGGGRTAGVKTRVDARAPAREGID